MTTKAPKLGPKAIKKLGSAVEWGLALGKSPSTVRRWQKQLRLKDYQKAELAKALPKLAEQRVSRVTDRMLDAAEKTGHMRWLHQRGMIPTKSFKRAVKDLDKSVKEFKKLRNVPSGIQRLRKFKHNELSANEASTIAAMLGVSMRQVYTMYHYL